jgi:dihydrodipicolinate reductase
MKIFVVGSGKLANAILSSGISFENCQIVPWEPTYNSINEKSIIIHAGSGRQLEECTRFCKRTGSVFIELSTGLETEQMNPDFTLIICPNISILVLKILNVIKLHGSYFEKDTVSIIESHQSSKTSKPGTAFSFADALKLPVDKIRSIREPLTQLNEIGIPREYLDKHAYHKITIKDGPDEVTIETKVLGHSSYTNGVKKIIDMVLKQPLEKRKYSVLELIDKNLL